MMCKQGLYSSSITPRNFLFSLPWRGSPLSFSLVAQPAPSLVNTEDETLDGPQPRYPKLSRLPKKILLPSA